MMDELLLTKYLLKETDDTENAVVRDWLAAKPANERRFSQLQQVWEQSKLLEGQHTLSEDLAWDRFVKLRESGSYLGNEAKRGYLKRLKWIRYAAAVLVIPAAVLLIQYLRAPVSLEVNYATTDSVRTETLADGSVITLNKYANLQYKQIPSEKRREATLTAGEVFFNVARDPDMPFVIHAGGMDVTVLGTSFHVRHDGDYREVIVETGVVRVEGLARRIELTSGQFVRINVAENRFEEGKVTDQLHQYYVKGKFVLDATPLWRIAEILGEAYDVPIVIENPEIRDLTMTTTFHRGDLDGILGVISQTLLVKVERRSDRIILK